MIHHHLFNDKSEIYAQSRPRYPQALYTFLDATCVNHDTVWDGACGNGQAAVSLAHYFQSVQATDISEQQIVNAIQNHRVTYSVQPSEATAFKDDQFDLICIAQALHWFDYDRFWPEVKRVLKPDGVFAAWGYAWFSINTAIDDCIQEKLLKPIEPYWAVQNKLLWNQYRDVPFPFTRIDVPIVEMSVEWDVEQLFAYLHSWSAIRRCMDDVGDRFFVEAYEAVNAIWGDSTEKKRVVMDFCTLVGRNS